MKAPRKQDFISAPMERIVCDIVGPLPESCNHNNYISVLSDYCTKYVEAYALADQTADCCRLLGNRMDLQILSICTDSVKARQEFQVNIVSGNMQIT